MSSIFTSSRIARIAFFGIIPLVVISAVASAMIATMAANRPEAERDDDREKGLAVFAVQAERSDVTLNVTVQGETRPREQINVVPQVAGSIVYVSPNLVNGGVVAEGETLIRINDADYRLAVTRAQAQISNAESGLERAVAQADVELAERRQIDPNAQLPPVVVADVNDARAQLAAARASLAEAELALERTEIKAPFNGRVENTNVGRGQYVTPGSGGGFATIYSTDVVEVPLGLTDQELALVGIPINFSVDTYAEGFPITLTGRAGGVDRQWRGRVMRTDAQIDARSRRIFVIAEVQDPFGQGASDGVPLPVGLFVSARIDGRTIEDAIALPRATLRADNQMYIANQDGTMAIRDVEVASTDRDFAYIVGGVEPEEYVIYSSVLSATDGMRVDVYDDLGELLFPLPGEQDDDTDTQGDTSASGECVCPPDSEAARTGDDSDTTMADVAGPDGEGE